MGLAFYAHSLSFSSLLSYFCCLLCIAYACIYDYINSIVGTCQALVQRESFIFCHYLWNRWDRGSGVFSVATTKCTGLIQPWSNFGLLFCLLVNFFKTAADLLQVTIAVIAWLESRFLVTLTRLDSRWERWWLASSHVFHRMTRVRVIFAKSQSLWSTNPVCLHTKKWLFFGPVMIKIGANFLFWLSSRSILCPKGQVFITCTAEVSIDRIRIGYPAGYLRFFWIKSGFGYLFLKKLNQNRTRIFVWFL